MTILGRTIGTNKSRTARLPTMRNGSHPHPFRQCPTFISPTRVSCVGKWQYLFYKASFSTYLYTIIFSPNKPNQQKKLFFLIKHPHFSWEGTKQTINLSLFVLRSPCLFEHRLSRYLWQPVGSN